MSQQEFRVAAVSNSKKLEEERSERSLKSSVKNDKKRFNMYGKPLSLSSKKKQAKEIKKKTFQHMKKASKNLPKDHLEKKRESENLPAKVEVK